MVERKPLSRGKRFVFGLILLGLLYGFMELVSFLTLSIVGGRPFSFTAARAQRQEAAAVVQDAAATAELEVLHPYVGYLYNPEAPELPVPGPVNQIGLPGSESPIRKRSPNKVIVGIFGGSVAFGFARDCPVELERTLQASPEFAGKKFEFVNASLQGYKQPQQLMLLTYLLSLGAEFDIVINLDGYNEMALYPVENRASHVFAPFPRLWQIRAAGTPDPQQRELLGQTTYLRGERARWALLFNHVPLSACVTAQLVWKLNDERLKQAAVRSETALRDYKPKKVPYALRGPAEAAMDDAQMYNELADYWVRGSIQMHNLCEKNGTRYVHLLQPNQYVAGSKELTDEEKKSAIKDGFAYNDGVLKGYPVLQARSAELLNAGVRYKDLTMVFKDVKETLYLDYCCHFNQNGNEILAREIGKFILESPAPGAAKP